MSKVIACKSGMSNLYFVVDGKEKMSKSLDNYIGIDEAPESMYEKAMKIPDNVLVDFFRLTTELDLEEMEKLIKDDIIADHKANKKVFHLKVPPKPSASFSALK